MSNEYVDDIPSYKKPMNIEDVEGWVERKVKPVEILNSESEGKAELRARKRLAWNSIEDALERKRMTENEYFEGILL